jgi:hypothetical protein
VVWYYELGPHQVLSGFWGHSCDGVKHVTDLGEFTVQAVEMTNTQMHSVSVGREKRDRSGQKGKSEDLGT